MRLVLYEFISAMKEKNRVTQLDEGEVFTNLSSENINQTKFQDLPLFTFEELVTATNSFHLTNKLGEGGFGLVYKVIVALIFL